MYNQQEVGIVIPVYKVPLSTNEKKVLANIADVFTNYIKILVIPKQLSQNHHVINCLQDSLWKTMTFNDPFFENILGYNKLLLSKEFYQGFQRIGINQILIHQLDAFVFSNQLPFWLAKGWDYIGAPWIDEKYYRILTKENNRIWQILNNVTRLIQKKKDWHIGNGGFSLRNVRKSLTVLKIYHGFCSKLDINEDMFWSIYAPLLYPFFKVPNLKEALGFAFEQEPERFYKMNNHQLPFGCHAWEKYNSFFWQKWIKLNDGIT